MGYLRQSSPKQVRENFQNAFLAVWKGELEDDGLNALVLAAGLNARQVTLIRAIAKYLRQGGISHSDAYIERTLLAHSEVTALLVRHDPDGDAFYFVNVKPGDAERLATLIRRLSSD